MRSSRFEALESRRLLASVTLFANTYDGGVHGWVDADAGALTNRMGGASEVPNYTLTIGTDSNSNLYVQSVTHEDGTATPSTSSGSNIVVIIDYSSVSTNPDYPLSQVGALIANYMLTTPVDGVRWAELPIHEMDLSRSCDLMDAISDTLGQAGVWVDQETYMDPHPIPSIGDPPPTLYDNVAFADCYWRTSGQPETGVEYNGEPVTGAYNQELPEVQLLNDGYVDAHVAVAGYYNGTIDFGSTYDGDGPVYSAWYGDTPDDPSRETTGFYYSAFAGGERPLSGVWSASGGTGTRTATGQVGTQWPNVTDISATGTGSVFSGQAIDVKYLQQDRGASSTVTFYLDSDQNPYNGVGTSLGTATLASSANINSHQFSASTASVAPGTYWILAKVSDGNGLYRYSYSQQVVVTAPVTIAAVAHATVSLVTGTTAKLDAVGDDADDGADLTYTWSVIRVPSGAAAPKLSRDGTLASQSTMATFTKDGTYTLRCTIENRAGKIAVSDTQVVVAQTATSLHVAPEGEHVSKGHHAVYETTAFDQFGHAMRTQAAASYSIEKGPASITPTSGILAASTTQSGAVLIEVRDENLTTTVAALVVP